MSEQLGPGEEKKTIAIRVSPELRGRLDSVLQITGTTVNEAGMQALEAWIAEKLADPKVREKALASLDEEESAIKARRKTLQSLIGEADASPQSGTRKGGKAS